jgi:PEP-CTERM motif
MKTIGITVGLAALLTAGSANAALVYDTITGQTPIAGYKPIVAANRGPLGDSFIASGPEVISSVTLTLKDQTNTDGGSVLVYLVPDAAGSGVPTLPSTSSLTKLSGTTLLGTIADSSLSATYANISLGTNVALTAGTYWIELVDASAAANGNGTTSATAVQWAYNLDTSGLGVPGSDFSSYANSGDNGLSSPALSNSGTFTGDPIVFQLQISTPEPASLALLGVGMMGLGFSRRRKAKKASM